MQNLILVKIGGGVITDKSTRYGLREDVLTRLVKEIAEGIRRIKNTSLIVGNGAGSFAHFSAHEYKTAEGFVDERSRVGMGWVRLDAVKLNQIVLEKLLSVGVPAFSFSPSSFISVKNGQVKNVFLEPITDALRHKMIPLVYGDPMVDQARGSGIFSTERVFDELAIKLSGAYKVRVIHISAEEGVYKKGQASVFETISRDNFEEVKGHLGGSKGIDVTGGMLHKVEECLELVTQGISSQIISGLSPGRVKEAITGNKVTGTTIC